VYGEEDETIQHASATEKMFAAWLDKHAGEPVT
jgi:hypothetical protein